MFLSDRCLIFVDEMSKCRNLLQDIRFKNFKEVIGLKDKSKASVAKNLGVNPYFVDDYTSAARNYPMRKVAQIIALLREADVKSKGVGANQTQADILKELLFKILH